VRIFSRKSKTHRTLGSNQIRVFHRRSEQLVGREARRELKEALAYVLGAEASPEATPTVDKHRPSHLSIVGLHCHSPPFKVSINMFPSSLWSCRSKPYQKLTTIARENSNSVASMSRRHPWPEPAASAVGSVPDDSCIGCEEPMATQH
jgi:hypothetical protein